MSCTLRLSLSADVESYESKDIFFFFKGGFCVSPEPYIMHTNWTNLQIFLLTKFCGTELNSV